MTRPLSRGERVAAYSMLFFASAGVLVFALTLPPGTQVGLGVGWGLLLKEALDWIGGKAAAT